jgi:dipeptide transport system ATP-binding protein
MSVRPPLRDWKGGQVRCHYPLGDASREKKIEEDGPVAMEVKA